MIRNVMFAVGLAAAVALAPPAAHAGYDHGKKTKKIKKPKEKQAMVEWRVATMDRTAVKILTGC